MGKRVYQTQDGTILEFRPVSAWTIQHITMKWERCRPLPPLIKTAAGEEYNENDEQYKHKLTLWTQDKTADLNETLVRLGILTNPPVDFVELYTAEFPDIEPKNIKVHWVYSLLGDADHTEQFFEVLTGQTQITEEGLKQAAQSFRSDDSGTGRTDVDAATRPEDG